MCESLDVGKVGGGGVGGTPEHRDLLSPVPASCSQPCVVLVSQHWRRSAPVTSAKL